MENNPSPNPKMLDDNLAEFTDRLLVVSGTGEEIPSPELGELAQTVKALKQAVDSTQPDREMRDRMTRQLKVAFRETEKAAKERTTATRKNFSIFSWGFAGVIMALMVLAVVAAPPNLSGAAGGDSAASGSVSIELLAIAGGLLVVYLLWLWLRSKK
jgi:hypothetical protein